MKKFDANWIMGNYRHGGNSKYYRTYSNENISLIKNTGSKGSWPYSIL